MFRDESVLALIPARGGSKGLPGKNVRPLAGRPMLAWSIEAARGSLHVDRVVVSSDDEAALAVARAAGEEVPLARPVELSGDAASMVDVAIHALATVAPRPVWLVLLQPTSPLRLSADIDDAFAVLARTGAASCVSVAEAAKSPYWMYARAPGERLRALLPLDDATRRQDLPRAYALNGAVYVVRVDAFERDRTFLDEATVALEMPAERSVDIDSALDFDLAELLFARRLGRGIVG